MSDTQEKIKINEIEKMSIIEIMNHYKLELIIEGYPLTMISYVQDLKEKLIKILDKQQD